MKQTSQTPWRQLCAGLPYASVMRWRQRQRHGKPVWQSPGPYNGREDLFQSVVESGKWELRPQFSSRREYASFNSYSVDTEAASKLQLIEFVNSAKYRYEFEVSDVSDKTRVPYGAGDAGNILEPLCRDYTGDGGGSQVLIEKDIPVKAIYDISVFPPQKKWDSQSGLIP